MRSVIKTLVHRLTGAHALQSQLDRQHDSLQSLRADLDTVIKELRNRLDAAEKYADDDTRARVLEPVVQMAGNADVAAELFNFVVKKVLLPHHKSVHWGDRLLTLDKAALFREDPLFQEAYGEIKGSHQYDQYHKTGGIEWRLATLLWAGRTALALPGDFVECGVFKGDMAAVLIKCLNFGQLDRSFYLYDSFVGLRADLVAENEYQNNPGYFAMAQSEYARPGLAESVRNRFVDFPNVKIMEGFVPESFALGLPDRIAYLHIDLNSAAAEVAALDSLFDRVGPGGIVVFDDFGWIDFSLQRSSETNWLLNRGYHVLELPTGQGLVVKR